MQNSGKIKIADLNKLLTCKLCKGYYIDATTIVECLHSFCRTCVLRYLQICQCCPTCHVQIIKPEAVVRSDPTLQDIVYKLVPGLFKNEMKRRRDFYSQQNPHVQSSIPSSSEKRGDVWGCDRLIFTPEDIISVSIEYHNTNPSLSLSLPRSLQTIESLNTSNEIKNQTHRRYLRCPGAVTVYHLKKFLRSKYGMNPGEKVDILYMHDILKDQYTLIDLAYIYSWKRNEPLNLLYKLPSIENKSASVVTEDSFSELKQKFASKSSKDFLPRVPRLDPVRSSVSVVSPAPSVATAPSTRHPSPPPSPQMAAEPKYIKMSKPNCAALSNERFVKFRVHTDTPRSRFKVVSKDKVRLPKFKPSDILPVFKKLDPAEKLFEPSLDDIEITQSVNNVSAVNGFKNKRKSVTFGADLVHTICRTQRVKRKNTCYSGKCSGCSSRSSTLNNVHNKTFPQKSS